MYLYCPKSASQWTIYCLLYSPCGPTTNQRQLSSLHSEFIYLFDCCFILWHNWIVFVWFLHCIFFCFCKCFCICICNVFCFIISLRSHHQPATTQQYAFVRLFFYLGWHRICVVFALYLYLLCNFVLDSFSGRTSQQHLSSLALMCRNLDLTLEYII